MEITDTQLSAAARLAIAGLIGLAFGLERQWSGHASGPKARFAGLRTFLILGLLGGIAGFFAYEGDELIAATMIGAGAMISIVAFVRALRRDPGEVDGTTEAAAILVVALAALAGYGYMLLAVSAGSIVVLALNEKKRLHGAIVKLPPEELRAALQFSVLALVVLPLLPEEVAIGGFEVHPRTLWMVVLLFCALNFAAYVAHRSAGTGRGYLLTGILGGVISSTAITVGFAQHSRREKSASFALAAGVIAACTVLVPRVLVISAVINPAVAVGLLPYIVPAGLIGALAITYAWRTGKNVDSDGDSEAGRSWFTGSQRSPLRFLFALQLAIIFQVAIVVVSWVSSRFTVEGLYGTAAVMGLTNADALTVSMSAPSAAFGPPIAARAIAIGILANTAVKLVISVATGSQRFRLVSASVLLLMAGSVAVPLILLER